MLRLVTITATLFAFWLLLSGNYKTWLVVSGALASVLVVAFSRSKRIVDGEGFPLERLPRTFLYWLWLFKEIVRSSIAVSRIILDPRLPITPTMVRVPAKQQTSVSLVTYANSITLTPGTISVEVAERDCTIYVHALTREGAEGMVPDDEMNDRVAALDPAYMRPAIEGPR